MIRFDTRSKKPKLWDLAVLTLLCAAAVILLAVFGGNTGIPIIYAVLDVLILTAIVRLVIAFFGQLQYNPYSYNTIFYSGFALFLLFLLALHVILTVQTFRYPEEATLLTVAGMLQSSAGNFMYVTFPFTLAFSAALCISNLSLIRHEGLRPVNILGLILSVLLIAGAVFLFLFDYYVSGSELEVMIHEFISGLISALYLYVECMLIGTVIANLIVTRYKPEHDKDFMIILGCGIRKDGTPSPLLRGRIDRALHFREEQLKETGKDLIFVTSGGQGPNEVTSESAAMKRYLLEKGIPEERIIEEDRSTSTFENMKFSKEKIEEASSDAEKKIAYATTNYHVFRSGLFARRVKMKAVGIGAKTKWYFWPNAAVREFVGLLTEHRGKQALIFGGILIANILMTLFSHQF